MTNSRKKADESGKMFSPALIFLLPLLMLCGINPTQTWADSIIIDHNSITRFSSLTDASIDAVQADIRWHYAHTSHGGQLTTGLSRLEGDDSRFDVSIGNRYLPDSNSALNIFNGQENDTYISPDEYWAQDKGVQYTRDVLDHNPSINVSAWAWCTQLDSYSTSQVEKYLSQMAAFENEFPSVTFVYFTGNAQATGSKGARRHANNELIRKWVRNSDDRVLFDFADLDAWWFNGSEWEQATYTYNGQAIPVEHSKFHGSQCGHTTYESCEQKGKAVWVMMDEIRQAHAAPIPGAVWLLGGGIAGLAAIRRLKD